MPDSNVTYTDIGGGVEVGRDKNGNEVGRRTTTKNADDTSEVRETEWPPGKPGTKVKEKVIKKDKKGNKTSQTESTYNPPRGPIATKKKDYYPAPPPNRVRREETDVVNKDGTTSKKVILFDKHGRKTSEQTWKNGLDLGSEETTYFPDAPDGTPSKEWQTKIKKDGRGIPTEGKRREPDGYGGYREIILYSANEISLPVPYPLPAGIRAVVGDGVAGEEPSVSTISDPFGVLLAKVNSLSDLDGNLITRTITLSDERVVSEKYDSNGNLIERVINRVGVNSGESYSYSIDGRLTGYLKTEDELVTDRMTYLYNPDQPAFIMRETAMPTRVEVEISLDDSNPVNPVP